MNAVGPSYDQSTTRLNHVRAVTRPRQQPRRRESARQGRGPAIEMRLAAGRQLPVDLCPVRCSPRALFFPCRLLLAPSGSIARVRERAYTRHGNEKIEGFLKKRIESWFRILWLQFRPDKCGFRLVILIFGTRRDRDIGEWTLEMNRKKVLGGRRL